MRILVVILSLVVTLPSGCSWIGVRVPKQLPVERQTLDCEVAQPIIDTIVGTVGIGAGAILVLSGYSASDSDPAGLIYVAASLPSLVIGAVYAASSHYGWRAYNRCRRIRDSPDHEYAIAYAQQAEAIAEAGDCRRAMEVGAHAATYEREVYVNYFLSRPAIVKCREFGNAMLREQQAKELAQRARDAAKSGDCDFVRTSDAQIEELDSDVHELFFARDPAVVRCQTPTPPPK